MYLATGYIRERFQVVLQHCAETSKQNGMGAGVKTTIQFQWASWDHRKRCPWFAHLDGLTFPVVGGRLNERENTRERKIELTPEAIELLRKSNLAIIDIQEKQCRSRVLPPNVLYIPEEFCTNPFE